MKIFLDADIKNGNSDLNNYAESPFAYKTNSKKGLQPMFMKKENHFKISDILAMQHPVTLSWIIISFILMSGLYLYTNLLIN